MKDPNQNTGLQRVQYELRASTGGADAKNKLRTGVHTRGYLPHVKKEGAWYFVTFRLADSLPKVVLLQFQRERDEMLAANGKPAAKVTPTGSRLYRRLATGTASTQPMEKEEIEREYHRKIERYLDLGVGACYLQRPQIAQQVAEALLFQNGKGYLLDEWVIMPNHVHAILWPMPNFLLSDILRDRKRRTGREANKILRRTGNPFWQHESYDHWIRDEEEKARIQKYVRNNPVLAKLCKSPEDWKWGSAGSKQAAPNG